MSDKPIQDIANERSTFKIYCPVCGRARRGKENFCPHDGTRLV